MRGASFNALRPLDYGVLLIAAALTFAAAIFVYGGSASSLQISVNAAWSGSRWQFPLDARETIIAQGPLGQTVIEIQNGAASIIASPCENKTCISSGAIHAAGQFTACLPNHVMITIEGAADAANQPDAGTW